METEKSQSSSKQKKRKSSSFTIEKSEDLRKEKVSVTTILLVEYYHLLIQCMINFNCLIYFHFFYAQLIKYLTIFLIQISSFFDKLDIGISVEHSYLFLLFSLTK